MSSHYFEHQGQANKLRDLASPVRKTLNWMVRDFLGEKGITSFWRDAVVNEIILKACDLTYDLKALDNTIEFTYKKIGEAYSALDNTSYSKKMSDLDPIIRFNSYYTWNKPNQIYIIPECVEMNAQMLKEKCNEILSRSDRISTTGVSSDVLKISGFVYDYGMIRRMAAELSYKGLSIASAMRQCMSIYERAERSYKSESESIKFIAGLSAYSAHLKNGNVTDINDIFNAIDNGGSLTQITGNIKDAGKSINEWLATIGEYWEQAKGLKNVKSTISGVTANADAAAKIVEGKNFSYSDLMSLIKADSSWLSSLLKSKSSKMMDAYKKMDKRTRGAKSTFNNAEKYSSYARGLSAIGSGADFFGNIYDYATHKDGTGVNNVVDSGIDFSESMLYLGYHAFNGSAATKKFADKAGGWFTLGKAIFDTGYQGFESYSKYNSDGKITKLENSKIWLESSLSGLNTIFSSVTFGLIEIDVDKTSTALYEWTDDVSYQVADKLAEKDNSVFDKFGIAVESMWTNRNTNSVSNDLVMKLSSYDNSAYAAYKAARASQIDSQAYDFSVDGISKFQNDLAAYTDSTKMSDTLSTEEKIQKFQKLINNE